MNNLSNTEVDSKRKALLYIKKMCVYKKLLEIFKTALPK